MSYATARQRGANRDLNKLYAEDQAIHSWYRFVLSFPPHLVRDYLARFDVTPGQTVLDPFCGTGTTLTECKKLGVQSVGIEANPMAHLASQTKTNWNPNPEELLAHARFVAERAIELLMEQGVTDCPSSICAAVSLTRLRSMPAEAHTLLLKNSISPLPLHKTLVLLECIERYRDARYYDHLLLALAKALTTSIGNLHFGPEVGVGPAKPDAAVVAPWLTGIEAMATDLAHHQYRASTEAKVHHADARVALRVLAPGSIDAVITSPPYPNEKDYTRTTRLESVILGMVRDKHALRELKKQFVRSNTRSVYVADDDDLCVAGHAEVQRIALAIEARRKELGKTSGFERQYHRVAKLYFGGMARHLADLRGALRPGARLAYVVGDQASYLRVMIRTGQILASIAQELGYELIGIDLFRTRLATATGEQLNEEVVLLRWPGISGETA